ncbi:MAG: FHA domain-containing protein [Verrucomicrobiales bacterium]|nr:FHA domain-containing protein [Verrucomicrobiales bacterium]
MRAAQRSLLITRRNGETTRLALEPGTYPVGRDEGNAIIIDHPSIAGRHCELSVFEDGGLLIRNLATVEETSIDGIPAGVAGLAPGQRLRLGEFDCWVVGPEGIHETEDAPDPTTASLIRTARAPLPAPQPAEAPGTPSEFWQTIPGALGYPVRGDGWIPLLLLVGFSQVPLLLPVAFSFTGIGLSFLIGAYLIQLAKAIVLGTADDPAAPFPSPDVSLHADDLKEAFLTLLTLALVCFGPAMATQWIRGSPAWLSPTLAAAGCLYFPMALLGVMVTEHFGALSPTFVLPSISRAPTAYALLALSFAALLLMGKLLPIVEGAMGMGAGVRLALSTGGTAAGFYLLFAWLRLLGLFYRHHRVPLGWGL